MKQVRDVLNEVKGEKLYKQAHYNGLKYKGLVTGWTPVHGQVGYKTENDTLVPVEPEEESELASRRGDPSAVPLQVEWVILMVLVGSFDTFMNKQNPMGMGTNIKGC